MSSWHMGIIKINKLGLTSTFKLADHEIKYMTVDNDQGILVLVVEGPLMPAVVPGENLQEVVPVYARDNEGNVTLKEVTWPTKDGDSPIG